MSRQIPSMKVCVCESSCDFPQQTKLIRDAYSPIACRHLRAFGIAHDQPHQIRPRLNVKTGLQGKARTTQAIESGIEQFHLDDFLSAYHIVTVLIKNCGSNGQVVAVTAIGFSKANPFHIHVGEHGEPGFGKIACNFSLRPYGDDRTLVTYECRTLATDEAARRGFMRYWRPLAPFIGVVMRSQLRVIEAETAGRKAGIGDRVQ